MDAASERNRIRASLTRRLTEKLGEARAVAVAGDLDRMAEVIWRVRQLRPDAFKHLIPERDER